jgi:Icc-related predicted phosphoesterase
MAKIQIVSDLHLEFGDIDLPIVQDRDLLIMAGDIHVGTQHAGFMNAICEHGPVAYVLGNHEYYNQDIDKIDEYWTEEYFHPHIEVLQCRVIEVAGLRIAGCTLWTDTGDDPYKKKDLRRGMTDFHIVERGGERFTPDMCSTIHASHRRWLLEQKDIDIVVTHHAPSYQSVTKHWQGHFLNPAFANNDEDVIDHLKPRLWVHGHMHSFLRYWHNGVADGTEVICNPRGYAGQYQERSGWMSSLTVEL